MLNLKEDTFFFQKFNLQTLRDCLQILIASISDRGSMKKIWIKLDTVSFIIFHRVVHERNYTSLFKKWQHFFWAPQLKGQLWWHEQLSKTTWVTLYLPTDAYFSDKVVFLLLRLMRSILSFICSCFSCLQAFISFYVHFTYILCHPKDL